MNKFINTLYTNDNLFILNGLNNESIDLIYLDPPFNSKRFYSAPIGSKSAGASFSDMWSWEDVNESYLEKMFSNYPFLVNFIQSIEGIHGKAMMAYITYMTQRIIEMHRVLKPTGSFYLHVDPTASHYLKIVLDKIFGKSNFRNEIIWQRMTGAKGSQFKAKKFGASTDTILFYTKSDEYHLNPTIKLKENDPVMLKKFNKIDNKGKRYYDDSAHIWRNPSMGDRPNLCYAWRGFNNPHLSGWRLSKQRLEEEYQKGNIVIKDDGKLERRKYFDDYDGKTLDNNWIDIPRAMGGERTGYPTQKPIALLNRIIKASSREGDIIFDPFCGCATACVAAQQLNRKWIGIDIEKQAAEVLVNRLSDDAGLFSNFIHRVDIPKRDDIKKELPSFSIKERLHKEQKGICKGCNHEYLIKDFHIDHIIPKAKGGGDYYENYQLLCGHCNTTKGDRPMEYLMNKVKIQDELLKEKLTFGK
ncbi:MAG: hypothetical protein DRQ51_01640 [Gammaproteobacteria bacterium]|nr:MAG: hypothetical protein DRQ51_01640 [Gammaproteobacteria bacterium]